MSSGESRTSYERLRQRWVDRAARRMFERLAANPESYRSAPSTVAATVVAGLVLATAVAYVGVLVWATVRVSGIGWVAVVLGWLVVIVVAPRPGRLPTDAVVLDERSQPALHAVVRRMAAEVGVPAPEVVAVDVGFNASVTSVGLRGRRALVLGLPLMTVLSWPARLGVIGHELGHLRGRDLTIGRLHAAAEGTVRRIHYLLAPSGDDRITGLASEVSTVGVAGPVTRVVQLLLAAPFLLLSLLLERLSVDGGQHAEYLADRRAAEVAGTDAMVEFLELDREGVTATATAAANRGEDPFRYLASRPPLTPAQRAARLAALSREPHRADATHPTDHLRIALLQRRPRPVGPGAPDASLCAQAERELEALRARSSKELSQALRFGTPR